MIHLLKGQSLILALSYVLKLLFAIKSKQFTIESVANFLKHGLMNMDTVCLGCVLQESPISKSSDTIVCFHKLKQCHIFL